MRFAVFCDESLKIGQIVIGILPADRSQPPQERLCALFWLPVCISNQRILDNRMDGPLFLGRKLMRQIARLG